MIEWIAQVPAAWKVVGALIAAVGLGAASTAAAGGLWSLPERVAQHEAYTDSMITLMNKRLDGLEIIVQTSLCLEVADRTGDDWRTCVQNIGAP